MNMNFPKEQGIELQFPRYEPRLAQSAATLHSPRLSSHGRLKYLLWPLAALIVGFVLMSASPTMLWIIGAVCVGLVAITTVVCNYVLDHVW